jgi:diguanylate cyclase (GGDEF)-like protein
MESKEFEQYQMTTEAVKDAVMEENRKLTRKLSEMTQSFELVKMVHFDKNIDLFALNDIIIGCTGCLYSIMFYNNQVITNLDKSTDLFSSVIEHKELLISKNDLFMTTDLINDYTIVMYPVSTSDMLSDSKFLVRHIVMLYPSRLMNPNLLDFIRSFMIVNEVLINIVLTRARMIELIEVDPLTQAYNRASWSDYIKFVVDQQNPYFLLFVDLDHFKNINDDYGHQTGDAILKFTSKWLKDHFRSDDRVFRLGGDEFAVTGKISTDHVDGLEVKLKRINHDFSDSLKKNLGIDMTISIGTLISKQNYTERELYETVDKLLYFSKENGRNKNTIKLDL